MELTEDWRKLHDEKLCFLPIAKEYLGRQVKGMKWAGMWGAWERSEIHIGVYCKTWKEKRDHFEDLNINGIIISKCTLNKHFVGARTGFIWLRIGTVFELLRTWQ